MRAYARLSSVLLSTILLALFFATGPGWAEAPKPTPRARAAQLQIESIEINQALGVQLNGALKFVAGKDTVIRAFLNEKVTVNREESAAQIVRDGQEVGQIPAKSYDKPTQIVDFLCPSAEACGGWAAGSYVFNVVVNGVSASTEGTQYDLVERTSLRILALPVKANYNGTITQVPDDTWKTMHKFTKAVYPVDPNQVLWDIRDEFDASDPKYNLETDDGQRELWQALTNLMPSECAVNRQGEGCYDLIVGFISDRPNTYPEGRLQGFTYGKPTNIVVAKDEDAPATVAHEVAHVYGVGDTYAGGSLRCAVNPAPDGFTGGDWDNPGGQTSCNQGRTSYPDASATFIPEAHHPYEVTGRGALGDMACYMGSGFPQRAAWTTQEAYDHLFEQLAPPAAAQAQLATSQRVLEFSGFIRDGATDQDDVDIDPWFSFDTTWPVANTTGKTQIVALDDEGNTVASQRFDLVFWVSNTAPAPATHLEWAPFDGAIQFPDNTAKFQIISGTVVLKEVPVSPNAPVVSNVTPVSTGQTIPGAFTITWNGTDADGDTLSYAVEYNPDVTNPKSRWEILVWDIDEAHWEEDLGQLAGGQHARFRITASDGVRTGTAESAEFVVPFKAPEVFIEEPIWGYSYEIGDEIDLGVEVYDLQDGWLFDDKLVWTAGMTILGRGDELIVDNLPMGEHVITLTATNSAGLTASAQVTVTVGNVTCEYIEYPAAADVTVTNTYAGLSTRLQVPVTTVITDTFVTVETLTRHPADTATDQLRFIGRYFSLSLEQTKGEDWIDVTTIREGALVTVSYAQPLPSGIHPGDLRLYMWNSEANRWIDVAQCQTAGEYDRSVPGQLSVRVCSLGTFALAAERASTNTINLPLILRAHR